MPRFFLRVLLALPVLGLTAAAVSAPLERTTPAPSVAPRQAEWVGARRSGVGGGPGDIVRAARGADAAKADALSRALRDQVNMARRPMGRQVRLRHERLPGAQSCARGWAGRGRSNRLSATPA